MIHRSVPPRSYSAPVHQFMCHCWPVFLASRPFSQGPTPCPVFCNLPTQSLLFSDTAIHSVATASLVLFKLLWLLLVWNVISALSMSLIFSLLEVLFVPHIKPKNNSFDTRLHRLLTARFCFTFWCYVTLYHSKILFQTWLPSMDPAAHSHVKQSFCFTSGPFEVSWVTHAYIMSELGPLCLQHAYLILHSGCT